MVAHNGKNIFDRLNDYSAPIVIRGQGTSRVRDYGVRRPLPATRPAPWFFWFALGGISTSAVIGILAVVLR